MNSTQPASTIQSRSERSRLSITAAYYAAFIGLGLTNASLGPLLPHLADQARVGLGQVSILFTGRWLGYLLGSLLGGRIYDRRRGHPVMAVSLILAAVTMALTPTIPLLWGLVMIMILLGASEASLDVGCNTLLIWLHGRKVAPFMNGLHFFYGLGALISPLIIAQAALAYGRSAWALWLIALLLLPAAFVLLRLPSPPAPETVAPFESGASASMQREIEQEAMADYFPVCLIFPDGDGCGAEFWRLDLYLRSQRGSGYCPSGGFTDVCILGRVHPQPVRIDPCRQPIVYAGICGHQPVGLYIELALA